MTGQDDMAKNISNRTAIDGRRQEPWHANPMVWLVIAIPSLTVAGCLLTAWLAVSNPDQLVGDEAGGSAAASATRK